ncbi:MAG: tetraacyldisaccharide 4'-kinase [Gammaproteobacteria bacterium]|nr:tetraacyldisaccharide 4'-kinase [Gammaproteobacteria bacterium]
MSNFSILVDLNKIRLTNLLLLPLSGVFFILSRVRFFCYKLGLFKVQHSSVPVIVVGNISAGGSGKTPIVIALCHYFEQQGKRVGVVSRGYGGQYTQDVLLVTDSSTASECGDEPALISSETKASVVVARKRSLAVQYINEHALADVIISDDGLQHYAMARKIEIAVVDGVDGFGNGLLLPAGPLREQPSRLKSVDIVINNGGDAEISSRLVAKQFVNAVSGEVKPLDNFQSVICYAVAGIAKPSRFFATLEDLGVDVIKRPFADHHPFSVKDLDFEDSHPILMTSKDYVKCSDFATSQMWYLAVNAELSDRFYQQLESKL